MNQNVVDNLISQHKKEKDNSAQFKQRRYSQWNENYLLYRDKVVINRLTQRQSINLPIIRESISTWISKIDEPPMLKFETRGRGMKDKDGEIILNELWSYTYDNLKLDILDNLDKKIVGLQGRSFKKWGISKNEIFCDLIDPYDIEIDQRANPLDLESADYVIHTHIFKPLREILANPKYETSQKQQLKTYLDTKNGIIKVAETQEEYERRKERLTMLGAHNYDEYQAADVMVEINESYKKIWNETDKKFVWHLIIIAADYAILYNKPLKEAIGINRLPIVSWASDPDLNDIWSDGMADNVRTINKVLNMYTSQDLENRAYRNFGMFWFDTLNGNFKPQAFEPRPFGMYGVPGKPSDVVEQMNIQPLGDNSNQIEFMKNLIQSSVAQTATERGETSEARTLGEVQLNLQQSQTRQTVVSKNYRKAWKESGLIFYELLNANSRGSIKLYKKGGDGNYYAKEITPLDWQNVEGYECKVVLQAEKDAADDMDLKKIAYIKQSFPNNPVAQKIARRKELELLDWTQDEIDQVMAAEDQGMQQMQDAQAAEIAEAEPILSPMQVNQPQL